MTDAPVNKGVLTDKEGAGFPGCRILVDGEQQDRPFTVLSFVQKYLDAIPKKARVCFTTKEGKITKVWEDKPAGEQKKEDCTSTLSTPATTPANSTGLKIVEGQITFLDHAAHKLIVKDRRGETTTFIWAPPFNDQMQKLKQWFFIRATGEHEPDFGLYRLTAQEYFKRPDDWPASNHGGGSSGGRSFQPRNEKIITYQTCYKESCETIRVMMDGWKKIEVKQEDEFNRLMDIALARAKKDAKELCEAAGVT